MDQCPLAVFIAEDKRLEAEADSKLGASSCHPFQLYHLVAACHILEVDKVQGSRFSRRLERGHGSTPSR